MKANLSVLRALVSVVIAAHYATVAQIPSWSLLNQSGILMDPNIDAWNAGRVTDVIPLEPGAGVLAASETAGVWSITDSGFGNRSRQRVMEAGWA